MRRNDLNRSLSILAATAAVGLALTACGGGGGDAAPSSPAADAAPVDAAKALTQADLPAGYSVKEVASDAALMAALQSVQQFENIQVDPAACKDKNIKAQQEVAETIKSGVQQTVGKGATGIYSITLLPSDVKPATFEAAGIGECAAVTLNGTMKQTTTRAELPAGVQGATGFVFEIARVAGNDTVHASSAYFTKGGVMAMVNANPGPDGTVDRAAFEDVVKRLAAKL
ncbi:hypothetical protein [Tsukamurella pseudospumae]|uniref:DUF5642 domain-containing protein n=1 Tax=Tsukamurella pseudospumae TaxID=239498 RepID=A0A137ZYZ7_9ACTN|nr:hypothetical protein [Tsukamurella pseudospumae]KXO99602.1 hypothetical protein AXK61_17430 [Tsukamurella pseudospumae]KXP03359.1 hypothetical protein AXK60_16120 [Tsukamurella pseudospumae]